MPLWRKREGPKLAQAWGLGGGECGHTVVSGTAAALVLALALAVVLLVGQGRRERVELFSELLEKGHRISRQGLN